MGIGDVLRTEIDWFYAGFIDSNRMYNLAKQGHVTPQMLSTYLHGVGYWIRNTVPTLMLASKYAADAGLHELSAFYKDRIPEEAGHEVWVETDRDALAQSFKTTNTAGQSHCLADQVQAQHEAIAADPRLYLVYMMFMEYFTVLAVPEWIRLMRERCGIGPEFMSVLTNHAEVDVDHVVEDVREINRFTENHPSPGIFVRHLYGTIGHYVSFCDEIAAVRLQLQARGA